ncbi:MAG: HAMP domain-containing histidine kinase [Rhodospirillales bacterium]|jgi:signal transduction histidine kinase|nr:HAMP domain-containing histidine kinase [Rhodospirillales bacterium]
MEKEPSVRLSLVAGLSARLLLLTVLFVMLAEVLIFVPSIARFRRNDLEDRLAKAHLAMLALEATPDNMVSKSLETTLLKHAGAYAIVLAEPDRKMLMLGEAAPPPVEATVDLREETAAGMIAAAFSTLVQTRNRVLKITGASPAEAGGTIAAIIDASPLRARLRAFSIRILTLSVIISLITAGLVFFALQWLMVRPVVQLTQAMTRFRQNPEDDVGVLRPGRRRDEIGLAQHELAAMQTQIRTALREKSQLAALGGAVARINHDLRNALSTAALASDRLSGIADPEVQRVTPKLYQAIDRAIALCTQTLDFVRDIKPTLRKTLFPLNQAVSEVEAELVDAGGEPLPVGCRGGELIVEADKTQFLRVLSNLAHNAAQAGARRILVEASRRGDRLLIDIGDDGPGIAAAVQTQLFKPFAMTGRHGGSGLGLAIAREIVRAHGGDLTLVATGPGGSVFRIDLPGPGHGSEEVAAA